MSFHPVKSRRKSIQHLKPYYQAPREPLMRLDQNTNLTGPNPVLEKIQVGEQDLSLYPSRDADDLLRALEKKHSLQEGTVTCTNGSDEALDLILKAYSEPGDTLATVDPSYSLYPFYTALHDIGLQRVPSKDDWTPDIDALLETQADIILVANPNNPTGTTAPKKELERLVTSNDGLVVIDEAYAEYHDATGMLPMIQQHRNLIVMRTFSKAHALAGIRLGWLAAHPETAEALRLVKPPFNVGLVTEKMGLLALQEDDFVERSVKTVREQRPRLAAGLKSLGFQVVPSQANFLLTFPPTHAPDGPTLLEHLREKGIATRAFGQHPRLRRAIRFTIGGPHHTQALLDAIQKTLEEQGGDPR
jgi:histidinol-phosphate aminotransferase